MKYIINNYFKLIIIILILINNIKCDLPQNQKNSIDTLIQIYNLTPINNNEYCTLLIENFKCNQNNTGVIQINLIGNDLNNKPIIPNTGIFKEFLNLTKLSIKNSIISNNNFFNEFVIVNSLQLNNCELTTTFPSTISFSLKELYMNDVIFQGDINLTSIDSITNFTLTYSSSDLINNYQIINDGVKNSNTVNNFNIVVNNFFEFPQSKEIRSGKFILGKYFNGNSLNNISKYKIQQFIITDENGYYNSNITYNFSDNNITAQKITYLTLSNLKFSFLNQNDGLLNFTNSNIISLTINNCTGLVDEASDSGIKLLPGKIQILSINYSNLKKIPNFSYFKNLMVFDLSNNLIDGVLPDLINPDSVDQVLNLDFSNNRITGTIPINYCYHNINLNNNLLNGTLPRCYICSLNDPFIRNKINGNNFENYSDGSSNSTWSKCDNINDIKILSKAIFSYTTTSIINGTLLGWQTITPEYIKSIKSTSIPSFIISVRIPNKQIELSGMGGTTVFEKLKELNFKVNLLFSIPNVNVSLEFDVSKPIVNSVTVSPYFNLGYSFLIIGSGFTTTSSKLKTIVTIDNKFECILQNNANGNNINCIIYQPQLPEKIYTITIYNNETGLTGVYNYQFERTYPYISAVYPSSSNGGLVTFYGSYGNDFKNVSIKIDDTSVCNIISINSSVITCNIEPGIGVHNVTLIVNGINWFAIDLYRYKGYEIPCPTGIGSNNNQLQLVPCSGNGICNSDGFCYCNIGFGGINCGIDLGSTSSNNNGIIISRNNDTTSTNIMSNDYLFGFSITDIKEINYSGQVVRQFNFTNWNLTNDSTNEKWTYINKIGTANTEISYTIELVQNQIKNYTFAGETLSLPPGSLKLSIDINNWEYLGSLNTLQLQIKSTVNIQQKQIDTTNECNNNNNQQVDNSIINVNSGDGISINYITIQKGNNIFSGRFIDKVESDGRPTFSKVTLSEQTNDSVTVSLSLPYCKICKIDPDWSLLITGGGNDQDSSSSNNCGNSNGNNLKLKWMIPTIIILGLFGIACISTISYFYIRKKLYFSKSSGLIFLKKSKSKSNTDSF